MNEFTEDHVDSDAGCKLLRVNNLTASIIKAIEHSGDTGSVKNINIVIRDRPMKSSIWLRQLLMELSK